MDFLISGSAICYFLMAEMCFCMQRVIRKEGINSKAITIFPILGSIAGLVFLVIVGINIAWYVPLIMLAESMILSFCLFFLEPIFAMVGFVGIPICGFLMFYLFQNLVA